MTTYYPRVLDSHAELGKTRSRVAEKEDIRSFPLGDAGIAAYHSGLIALDNIGLGSSEVTRRGLDSKPMNRYGVDLIAILARAGGILAKIANQQKIFDWANTNSFMEVCDIYWRNDRTLKIYARKEIPAIIELCESSKSKTLLEIVSILRRQ